MLVIYFASPAVTPQRRNPRRAYDSEGREIEPMPLANMRELGEGPYVDASSGCNGRPLICLMRVRSAETVASPSSL
jgi:hypothetical protein